MNNLGILSALIKTTTDFYSRGKRWKILKEARYRVLFLSPKPSLFHQSAHNPFWYARGKFGRHNTHGLTFFNNLSGIIIDEAHNPQDWKSPDPCLKGVHSLKFFFGSKPILMFAPPISKDRKRIMHRILGLRGTSLEVKEPSSTRKNNI